MKLENNQTLLFIGDSITDCGRQRPVGQRAGLGSGYVSLADALLGALYPEINIRSLNTGISGNRVTDLANRWQEDVLDLKPDWLSICIGINDVWRQFDNALSPNQVTIEIFRSTYSEIIEKTQESLKGLILISPFYLEPNQSEPMRAKMDAYGAVVKELADKYDAVFVDAQAAFDAYLSHRHTMTLCSDRVHPNATGHMVIAQAFVKALTS